MKSMAARFKAYGSTSHICIVAMLRQCKTIDRMFADHPQFVCCLVEIETNKKKKKLHRSTASNGKKISTAIKYKSICGN